MAAGGAPRVEAGLHHRGVSDGAAFACNIDICMAAGHVAQARDEGILRGDGDAYLPDIHCRCRALSLLGIPARLYPTLLPRIPQRRDGERAGMDVFHTGVILPLIYQYFIRLPAHPAALCPHRERATACADDGGDAAARRADVHPYPGRGNDLDGERRYGVFQSEPVPEPCGYQPVLQSDSLAEQAAGLRRTV